MKPFNAERRYWGDRDLPKAKAEFFNVVTTPSPAGDGSSVATIRLYGPIDSYGGYWGVCTQDIAEVIDNLGPEVTQIIARINSPGGDMFEGIAILNMLRAHKASLTAVVDGMAASAASIIAAGADECVMSPGSTLMIHDPSAMAYGNAEYLRQIADSLDVNTQSIIEVYTAKAGDKPWASLMDSETWLSATQAVELGLADSIGVVPDAGVKPSENDDEDPDIEITVLIDGQPVTDSLRAEASAWLRKRSAQAPQIPAATAPGTEEEGVVMEDDITQTDAVENEDVETPSDEAEQVEEETAETPDVASLQAENEGLRAALAERTGDATEVEALRETNRVNEREAFLDKHANRFAAKNRADWAKRYDASPDVIRELLPSLPVIVNTSEKGYTASSEVINPRNEVDDFEAKHQATLASVGVHINRKGA